MLDEFLSKIASLRESNDDESSPLSHISRSSRQSNSKSIHEDSSDFQDQTNSLTPPEPYTPKSLQDFIGIIKRTPVSILSKKDRARIAAVMSFDDRIVADLMIPKSAMVFVNCKDLLGPLMLDRLYKSGFTNFPVVDNQNHVKGVIHTEALNALEIKKTDRAEKYMDKTVSYLHTTDSLEHAVSEIERTNSYYFLVLDPSDGLAGFFTAKMLLDYLLD